MSYVIPNASIKILQNVPIERSYEHSLYFANSTAQYDYFNGKTKYTFSDMSHIRVTTPGRKIRVEKNINDLYDCNYLIIQNYSSSSGKIFYCFIDNVEYVNENVSEISYSIDVLQTWLFDYQNDGVLNNMCMVERQHNLTDDVGDNLIPEPVNLGDYISDKEEKVFQYTDPDEWYLVIALACNINTVLDMFDNAPATFYGGTMNTINYVCYPLETENNGEMTVQYNVRSAVSALLAQLVILGRLDCVINIFMSPKIYFKRDQIILFNPDSYQPTHPFASYSTIRQGQDTFSWSIQESHVSPGVTPNIDPGYTDREKRNNEYINVEYEPYNKKLLTYPYCYLEGSNNQGQTVEYKFELFDPKETTNGVVLNHRFEVYTDQAIKPTICCAPINYDTTLHSGIRDWKRALQLTNFPQCTWLTNDLIAKITQAAIGMAITAGGFLAGGLIGASAGSAIGEAFIDESDIGKHENIGAHTSISSEVNFRNNEIQRRNNQIAENEERKRNEKTSKNIKLASAAAAAIGNLAFKSSNSGMFSSGAMNLVTKTFCFIFRRIRLKTQFARIIDQYFTMYGYAQKRVMSPTIYARKRFTYVQTNGCSINANIPNDDAEKIDEIFDRGVTFWNDHEHIKDYSYIPTHGGTSDDTPNDILEG